MDKDVYGVHLRQHLASERRKTTTTASNMPTTANPNEHNPNKSFVK